MDTIHLSPRLKAVLQFIPKSRCLADIGSDHAHLPCRAIQDGRALRAIAGEVRSGPFHQSTSNVAALGFQRYIDVRLGDGLDVIREPGEADAVVIAGMGGELITDILERGKAKINKETALILQPNIREASVRKWLNENSWTIINEAIVEEPPHIYEIILARKETAARKLSELELKMGPILSIRKELVFLKKWKRREQRLIRILQALGQAEQTAELARKREESERELRLIRVCLNQN
ncbi:class I SAM-dependent methyltransferase [Sporolactobacillus shoreicorticis]|uniref:tRNA (Adenine(22)-N(1))-methyltransferase n=1 Tax=Sporolactobacillus shoreicorticis TaxID=1923877 RepID=A0ABW5S589_9BACL|nr:class I SAM-dependent methyltransferase [Sporolactobacillus shoreicorticis]MCO7126321.1 class I SAM-dependent methyltransferase [Sporolactobacillus shoreicorticis]